MTPERYKYITEYSKLIIEKYDLGGPPADLARLARCLNIGLYPYSGIDKDTRERCKRFLSRAAFFDTEEDAVYYNDLLDDFDYAVAHELGHILLGHADDNLENEEEANIMATHLRCKPELAPPAQASGAPTGRTGHKKRWFILLGAVCALVLFGTLYFVFHSPVAQSAGNPSANLSGKDVVYITKSGASYHLQNCYHIRGRSTFTLTAAEAIHNGYNACRDCIGS